LFGLGLGLGLRPENAGLDLGLALRLQALALALALCLQALLTSLAKTTQPAPIFCYALLCFDIIGTNLVK